MFNKVTVLPLFKQNLLKTMYSFETVDMLYATTMLEYLKWRAVAHSTMYNYFFFFFLEKEHCGYFKEL